MIGAIVAALVLVGIGVAIGLAARQNAVYDARDQASAALQQKRGAQADAKSQADQVASLRNEVRARDAQIAALQQQVEQGPSSGSTTTLPPGSEIARSFGNGLFAVGTDIEAGRYRTEGAPACYWAKLSGSNTNMVLVDHLGDGPQTVTIDSPFFVSDSCGTWTKVG